MAKKPARTDGIHAKFAQRTWPNISKKRKKLPQVCPTPSCVRIICARFLFLHTQKRLFDAFFLLYTTKPTNLLASFCHEMSAVLTTNLPSIKKKLWLLWKNGPRVPFPFSLSLKWLSTFFNWHQSSYTYMVQKTRSQKGRRILLEVYIIFWTSPAEHQPTREKNKLFFVDGGDYRWKDS